MPRIRPPSDNLVWSMSPLVRKLAKRPRDVKDQQLPAKIIVDHITGRATWNNALKYRQDPLQRVEDLFDDQGHAFAQYTIDPWGWILCSAEEHERPWAQGWGKYGGSDGLWEKLHDDKLIVPQWWLDRWVNWRYKTSQRTYETPHELVSSIMGFSSTPNDRSIAIEHIQYGNGFKLTAAQYRMSYLLHMDISMRHGIHVPRYEHERLFWLGHEDVDPWGRGTDAGGWDPGALRKHPRFCWHCLITQDFTHGGSFPRCPRVRDTPKMPKWLKKQRGLT